MTIPKKINAIGFTQSLPIDTQDSLYQFELDTPIPRNTDLLVKIEAISVNPADAKIRVRAASDKVLEHPRVLGYDAVGTIVDMGTDVDGFQIGDRVFYAGEVTRQGSNAEYQNVDYRIVAHAPKQLTVPESAALPLTALTAWEALFDRLKVEKEAKKTLLIIGGSGGVGSMTIQLAKQLTHLTVIATASRPESTAWAKKMGADLVANHQDLVASVRECGVEHVDYIFNTADTKGHWDAMVELIAPQGMICSIVEFDGGVELSKLQGKSVGFIWELMFTRSLYQTADLKHQQYILSKVAELADRGKIRTTLTKILNGFDVEQLKKAHTLIETGSTIGKIVIEF